jgi:hypothetical protein
VDDAVAPQEKEHAIDTGMPVLLRVSEVARTLGISIKTVHKLVRERKPACVNPVRLVEQLPRKSSEREPYISFPDVQAERVSSHFRMFRRAEACGQVVHSRPSRGLPYGTQTVRAIRDPRISHIMPTT